MWRLSKCSIVVFLLVSSRAIVDRIVLVALHELGGAARARPEMLPDVRVQVQVTVLDVDHAVEDHVSFSLSQHGFCVEAAMSCAILCAEVFDWSLTTPSLA